MLYSKQTGGFYLPEIHGNNIPEDAVEITDEHYRAVLDGQSTGKNIVADDNGYPMLDDTPVLAPVPQQVTKFQAKAALYLAGKLDDVETVIADPNTDRLTVLAWTESLHFERQSTMIKQMAVVLGMSDEEVDNLFRVASQIN